MEKSEKMVWEKTIACTMTLPGACWFDGGSWRRSRSSCWEWRWLAWTWWRTFPSSTSDRALTRGWSCWLSTIFARWWWRATPCPSASTRGRRASFRVDGGGVLGYPVSDGAVGDASVGFRWASGELCLLRTIWSLSTYNNFPWSLISWLYVFSRVGIWIILSLDITQSPFEPR